MNFIPVNEPLLSGNEKKYLCECIDSGWISSEGSFVRRLEEQFAELCGQRHGIAVVNGSAALDVAVRALGKRCGWDDGDEVIVPDFTIMSCAQSVLYSGLKPVFVDCEPVTFNMDPDLIEGAITPRTRAIMVAHIYGLPTDMGKVAALADKHGLKIIEDAAEAHGQRCGDGMCGGFGDVSTFSFYANKHVATGEGGMILASDPEIAEACRSYRNLCFIPESRYVHRELGWNYRMSNLQAAVGVAQLERLREFIELKRKMGAYYTERLSGLPLQLPVDETPLAYNHYWVYPVVIKDEAGLSAKEAMAELAKRGIGTRPFFHPMHLQPVLGDMGVTDGVARPVSERIHRLGFYIPSGLGLTEEKMEIVVKNMRELFS